MGAVAPIVRVRDAHLADAGGAVRVVVTGLPCAADVVATMDARGLVASLESGRAEVVAPPGTLIEAVAEFVDAASAARFETAVRDAIGAWSGAPPDLHTPAGSLPTATRPVVMGVINVTPDSFSDGGHHLDGSGDPAGAIAVARAMLDQGADLIDVGGESTRPGATPVPADEELRRVLPVVSALAADGAIVAVDTIKSQVARAAVDAGAAIVNDVSAGSLDPQLWPTVAELGVPYVLTHLQGTPQTMQDAPSYDDVVAEVFETLTEGVRSLAELGLPAERIVVDPGIGFGKTVEHNLALLRSTRELTSLGRPVMIGTSRKGFIGRLTGVTDPLDRLAGSLATASVAVADGARLVRAHDVADTVRAVTLAHAVAVGPPA